MIPSERLDWRRPTLTLCVLWSVITSLAIAVSAYLATLPPFVLKAGPFLIAGLITGRAFRGLARGPRLVATAGLALLSAVGWTLFSFATTTLSAKRALVLFAVSIPVHLLAAAWAYLGMFLGARRTEAPTHPTRAHVDRELEDLEDKLRDELEQEQQTRT